MKINAKTIFLAVLVIIVVGYALVHSKGGFTIAKVIDGSTIQLDNGTRVKLIGISNTEQSLQELESLGKAEVELQPDGTANFDPHLFSGKEVVYAYLLLTSNSYECINATILRKGLAQLVEGGCLRDSLYAFRKYAEIGAGQGGVTPTPIVQKIDYSKDSINLPQYTPQAQRRFEYLSTNESENIELLKEACDYNLPYTKMFANQLAARAPGMFGIEQVCEIFSYCYNKWRYVNDPKGQEYVARASESIAASLTGDCDDYAVLIAACVVACGGDARIVLARGANGGHAYTEADINSFSNKDISYISQTISERFAAYNSGSPNIQQSGNHQWLNLDWQAAYPGGPLFDAQERKCYDIVDGQWSFE